MWVRVWNIGTLVVFFAPKGKGHTYVRNVFQTLAGPSLRMVYCRAQGCTGNCVHSPSTSAHERGLCVGIHDWKLRRRGMRGIYIHRGGGKDPPCGGFETDGNGTRLICRNPMHTFTFTHPLPKHVSHHAPPPLPSPPLPAPSPVSPVDKIKRKSRIGARYRRISWFPWTRPPTKRSRLRRSRS